MMQPILRTCLAISLSALFGCGPGVAAPQALALETGPTSLPMHGWYVTEADHFYAFITTEPDVCPRLMRHDLAFAARTVVARVMITPGSTSGGIDVLGPIGLGITPGMAYASVYESDAGGMTSSDQAASSGVVVVHASDSDRADIEWDVEFADGSRLIGRAVHQRCDIHLPLAPPW